MLFALRAETCITSMRRQLLCKATKYAAVEQLVGDSYTEPCHRGCDQNNNNSRFKSDTWHCLPSASRFQLKKSHSNWSHLFKSPKIPQVEQVRSVPVAWDCTVCSAPASVGSYHREWRLLRIMLHTVVFWGRILVQVGLAPCRPQALVRAAHLTHGRVAHDARYSGLSHQSVRNLSEHLMSLIIHFPNPPPQDLPRYHARGGGPPESHPNLTLPWTLSTAPVPVSHLTGLVSRYYWQHGASASSLLMPTPWPLTNISPPTPPPIPAIFTPTSLAMHAGREERGWAA